MFNKATFGLVYGGAKAARVDYLKGLAAKQKAANMPALATGPLSKAFRVGMTVGVAPTFQTKQPVGKPAMLVPVTNNQPMYTGYNNKPREGYYYTESGEERRIRPNMPLQTNKGPTSNVAYYQNAGGNWKTANQSSIKYIANKSNSGMFKSVLSK